METKKKHLLLVTLNCIAVIATIIVNALAIILPLNGKTTNELSDAIPNLFVPAGITFSIWSIIYLFLIAFMLYQILGVAKKDKAHMMYLEKIGGWFLLASLANITWIFLWHYEYVTLSLGAMVILFLSLLLMYLRLNIGLSNVTLQEKIVVHVTMSIYLGWITVATIANITAVLVKLNVGELFLGQVTWTILVIAVATLITVLMLIRRKDIAYSLVIIWALLGIIIKRFTPNLEIAITAAIGILIVMSAMFAQIVLIRSRKKLVS